MRETTPLKVVTGLHRSGTTYTGKILSDGCGVDVVHEPFSPHWGVREANFEYTFTQPDAPHEQFEQVIADVFDFTARWTRRPPERTDLSTELTTRAFGGRSGLRWAQLKARKRLGRLPGSICWKDPFLTFALAHVMTRYDARAVCLVRHPGALWLSNSKLDWFFDVRSLRSQPSLVERYGSDVSSEVWDQAEAGQSPVALALLWKLMARVVSDQAERDDRLIAIRHEDLCTKPILTARRVAEHLDVAFGPAAHEFVERTSSGSRVDGEAGRLHSFTRDSNALANAWRPQVSEEHLEQISQIIGADLLLFYPAW